MMATVKTAQPLPSNLRNAQQEALQNLASILGTAGILGAGTRAALGLQEMLSRNLASSGQQKPMIVDIPVRKPKPKKEEEEIWSMPKPADDRSGWNILGGPKAQTRWDIPAFAPAAYLGAPLTAIAAYKVLDKLLAHKRRKELEEDITDTREDYRKSLLSQLTPRPGKAAASEDTVAHKLDELANRFSSGFSKHGKTGWDWLNPFSYVPDSWKGPALGGYLTLGGGLGLLSGKLLYDYTRQINPEKLKAEAIKKQIREGSMIPPTFARIVPTESEDEEEETKIPAKKASTYDCDVEAKRFVNNLLSGRLVE